MYARHRLDFAWRDLAYGFAACVGPRRAEDVESALLRDCGLDGPAQFGLTALSVRSAWDLLLSGLDWAPGDEIIVSAITHPDMVTILHAHGLRAVSVDLDPDTLAPSLGDLQTVVTPRTRALLLAHLFGGLVDLAPFADFAQRHGLLLVEDAAQAFTGPESLRSRGADVALYSFGMIKTASAAGGALLVAGDPGLVARLELIRQGWARQTARDQVGRLLKVVVLKALGWPPAYGLFFWLCDRLGRDPDRLINASTRTFAGGSGAEVEQALPRRVRRRPSAALLRLLRHRLGHVDRRQLHRRAQAGEWLSGALSSVVLHPGRRLHDRTHWLFPVVAAEPVALVKALRERGLDASRGTSNLRAVAGSDGRVPPRAAAMMASVVYLPSYPELPQRARWRLADVVRTGPK